MDFTIGGIVPVSCKGCGQDFTPTQNNQERCRPRCSKKAVRGNGGLTRFRAVDGEGITLPDGTHHYVLLSVGSDSLHRSGEPLDILEIFEFLWRVYDPRYAYVGFFLGYDFTMWLKSLPLERARMLFTPEGQAKRARSNSPHPYPVEYRDWEFDIMNMRRFRLRAKGSKKPWMTICDAGSFFQTSLINVINPSKWTVPILSDKEWEIILEGKSARSTASFDPKMIEYNKTENAVLERLMERLDEGFAKSNVYLSKGQWFGPGQSAKEWLDMQGSILSSEVTSYVQAPVLLAARNSYYGGWFDIFSHGHVPGRTYGYDINSAYPMAISQLPCLKHGAWVPWAENDGGSLAIVYASVEFTKTFNGVHLPCLPHRDKDGHILRPLKTEGYFWYDELLASVPLGAVFHVEHGWTFHAGCDERPYAGIEELYYRRLEVGKNTPHGMAAKLLINSCYGKFAQSVGTPRHSNPVYASLITSRTRQMIIEAIASHPKPSDLVMVATDGVYFRSPHPHLELSPTKLGLWDEDSKDDLTLVMPGVYWDRKFRENVGSTKLRSRGVSASDLAYSAATFDELFDRFNGTDWPSVDIPINFGMVSARQSVHRGDWGSCGKVYSASRGDKEAIKSLSSNPKNKRRPRAYKDGDVWRTYPYYLSTSGQKSAPYSKGFGIADSVYSDLITPDGLAFDGGSFRF